MVIISICKLNFHGIANAANLKRHQQLDEIFIIFTRTIYMQEISKVVCKKTLSQKRAHL